MKRILTSTLTFTIMIGTIAYAVAFIMALANGGSIADYTNLKTYIVTYGEYQNTLYYIDFKGYLDGINSNITTVFKIKTPEMPNIFTLSWVDAATLGIKTMFNIFIWLTNWLSWITNYIVVIPLKLLLQPVMMIMTILGINNRNLGVYLAVEVVYSLNIPYIPYWS